MIKKIFYILAIVLLFQQNVSAEENKELPKEIKERILFNINKFGFILETIWRNYPDSVDIDKISESGFKYVLKSIDPYSAYIPKELREMQKEKHDGETIGIGVKLILFNDTLLVYDVAELSPADSAGIKVGDRVLFIGEKKVLSMQVSEADKLLKGEKNTYVDLIIFRDNSLIERQITRNSFPVRSLRANFVLPGTKTAYFYFDNFSHKSHDEFVQAASKLNSADYNSVIIDLRSNAGGFLEESAGIISEFFDKGKLLVTVKGKEEKYNSKIETNSAGRMKDLPLVVLIDNKSASASEIFGAVIQDYDRGIIAGERSYGKGSAQRIWDLKDGSAIRLTVAKYTTPSGRTFYRKDNIKVVDDLIEELDLDTLQAGNIADITSGEKSFPIFKSAAGRSIIGGGTLIPDHIYDKDKSTQLTAYFIKQGIINQFALLFYLEKKTAISNKFNNDYIEYAKSFSFSENDIAAFKKYAQSKKTWNDEMFFKDSQTILGLMKASVASYLWGQNASKLCLLTIDNTLLRAIDLVSEAKKMLK